MIFYDAHLAPLKFPARFCSRSIYTLLLLPQCTSGALDCCTTTTNILLVNKTSTTAEMHYLLYVIVLFSKRWGCSHSVMVKALDCWIVVALLHSHYLYSPSCGLNNTTTVLQGWLWNLITHEGWYAMKQTKRNQLASINKENVHIMTQKCIQWSSSAHHFIAIISHWPGMVLPIWVPSTGQTDQKLWVFDWNT